MNISYNCKKILLNLFYQTIFNTDKCKLKQRVFSLSTRVEYSMPIISLFENNFERFLSKECLISIHSQRREL